MKSLLAAASLLLCISHSLAAPDASATASAPSAINCQFDDGNCLQNKRQYVAIDQEILKATASTLAYQTEVEQYKNAGQHRSATLWAQYYQSWIICVMVLAIIGVGLYMSWKHMQEGFKNGISTDNAFEIGKDGIKIKSPVIGLIIFTISTYFFSIYVDKVYTISLINTHTANDSTSDGSQEKNEKQTETKKTETKKNE
ncbi:MAG: hypothetical protein WA071_26720 [Undibacterium umbellatum]|uniref:hypothetical protein n=1 Tax=Undibacterium umbellatum TaxID=2762300 RepID=UPI003BB52AFE